MTGWEGFTWNPRAVRSEATGARPPLRRGGRAPSPIQLKALKWTGGRTPPAKTERAKSTPHSSPSPLAPAVTAAPSHATRRPDGSGGKRSGVVIELLEDPEAVDESRGDPKAKTDERQPRKRAPPTVQIIPSRRPRGNGDGNHEAHGGEQGELLKPPPRLGCFGAVARRAAEVLISDRRCSSSSRRLVSQENARLPRARPRFSPRCSGPGLPGVSGRARDRLRSRCRRQ